jgi:hypothetical protein
MAWQELEALREEGRMNPGLPGLADTYSERDPKASSGSWRGPAGAGNRLLLHRPAEANDHRGDRHFYLDLLFYHRSLRRLVAIELELESFDAAHKGKMELCMEMAGKV